MGFYNVVKPCVVGKLHYATVPSQPIEVDDGVAAPLVESGCLAPYGPNHGGHVHVAPQDSPLGWVEEAPPAESGPYAEPGEPIDDEPPTDPPPPRTRGRRKSDED